MRLQLRDLAKAFGAAPALRGVDLDLHAGEVHALLGENGAGKSTLIRILAGATRPDAGTAAVDGAPLALGSASAAARAGLRFVHQELNVAPALTVAETVLLGRPWPRRGGIAVDWRAMEARAASALARLGAAHVDPRARMGRLGLGDRMLVRLAALLADDAAPAVVVLDEPTAALTEGEAARLFAALRDLKAAGAAILYVSHRLPEVMALADRATVLRDGAVALSAPLAGTSREGIVQAMTGRGEAAPHRRVAAPGQGAALSLRGVSSGRLRGLDLAVAPGEVLGVAGIEGAGGSDLLRLLLGDGPRAVGVAEALGGRLPRSPAEAWARGVAYVPRERRAQGLMLGRGVTANAVLAHLRALLPWGLARPRAEAAAARVAGEALRLRAASPDAPVRRLSGGNQQKVMLARAAMGRPRLLLLDEPTRGVDVGAREDVHRAVRALAAAGAAVVVASSDLPELLALSDRILVLRDGAQAALVPAAGLDPAALLHLVQGEGRDAA